MSLLILLSGVSIILAYNSGASPSVMGHSGEELEITVNSVTKPLQQAINDGDLTVNYGTPTTSSIFLQAGDQTGFDCPSGQVLTGLSFHNDFECELYCGFGVGPIYIVEYTCTELT